MFHFFLLRNIGKMFKKSISFLDPSIKIRFAQQCRNEADEFRKKPNSRLNLMSETVETVCDPLGGAHLGWSYYDVPAR